MKQYPPPFQTQLSSELNNSIIKYELLFDPVKGVEYLALPMYAKIFVDLSNLGGNDYFVKILKEKYDNGIYAELFDQIIIKLNPLKIFQYNYCQNII